MEEERAARAGLAEVWEEQVARAVVKGAAAMAGAVMAVVLWGWRRRRRGWWR